MVEEVLSFSGVLEVLENLKTEVVCEGEWVFETVNGVKHGYARRYFNHIPTSVIEICAYQNGMKNGIYMRWDPYNHRLLDECYYVNDKKHGPSFKWRPSTGVLFQECTFNNDLLIGQFKFRAENAGDWTLIGNYDSAGKIHGELKTYHNNGKIEVICYFENGLKHGLYQSWDEEGRKIESCYYEYGSKITDV